MPHNPPTKLDVGKIRLALGNPDTPGLVLLTISLWSFGDKVFGNPEEGVDPFDVAEMWAELHSRYGTWVTEEGENKMNAILTGLQNGMFWADKEVFVSVAAALFDGDLGDIINGGFEDLGAAEIMWAVLEMSLAADDPEGYDLSPSLQAYVDSVISAEQENLDEVTSELESLYSAMLNQLQDLGVPSSAITMWEENYEEVMEENGLS